MIALVHNWQIFLLVCALPSLVSGIALYALPESPRFLMSQGRNAEALQALQLIYHINTGKPKDAYPVDQVVQLRISSRVLTTLSLSPSTVRSSHLCWRCLAGMRERTKLSTPLKRNRQPKRRLPSANLVACWRACALACSR